VSTNHVQRRTLPYTRTLSGTTISPSSSAGLGVPGEPSTNPVTNQLYSERPEGNYRGGKGRRVPRPAPDADVFDNDVARIATVKSWDKEFRGDLSTVLRGILRHYMTIGTSLYASVVPHVQSSGTGKSRTHDELAKRIFYIPLNLANSDATSMLSVCVFLSLRLRRLF